LIKYLSNCIPTRIIIFTQKGRDISNCIGNTYYVTPSNNNRYPNSTYNSFWSILISTFSFFCLKMQRKQCC
jgi:hypothetical protein